MNYAALLSYKGDSTSRAKIEASTVGLFQLNAVRDGGVAYPTDIVVRILHILLCDLVLEEPIYSRSGLINEIRRSSASQVTQPVRVSAQAFREVIPESLVGWSSVRPFLTSLHFDHAKLLDNRAVAELGRMHHLVSLSLRWSSESQIDDLTALAAHPSLTSLDLRGGAFGLHADSLAAIASIPNLKLLDMGSMQIGASAFSCLYSNVNHTPTAAAYFPTPKSRYLDTQQQDDEDHVITCCPSLTHLSMDGTNISTAALRCLEQDYVQNPSPNKPPCRGLPRLEVFVLESCGLITDASPLASLRSLKKIRLGYCLEMPSQPTIAALATLPHLEFLELKGCKSITDIRGLRHCASTLRHLNLRMCSLTDDAVVEELSEFKAVPINGLALSAMSKDGAPELREHLKGLKVSIVVS